MNPRVNSDLANSVALPARPLAGKRILVVEDDFLILLELEELLLAAGAESPGLCRSVDEALPLARSEAIDAALLDIRVRAETVAPVAAELARRQIPFAFYTGQSESDPFLSDWPGRVVVLKPAWPNVIVTTLARLLPH